MSTSHPVPGHDSTRRLRACTACKESKVRCKRGENRENDACERCVGAGRQCIVSTPARSRRPRRNVSTVASLESKVDALVAALQVQQADGREDRRRGSPLDPTPDPHSKGVHPNLRRNISPEDDVDPAASSSSTVKRDHSAKRRVMPQAEHQYSIAFFMPKAPNQDDESQEDVIDQELITMEEADQCFARFTESMLPHFPVVIFPPGTTALVLRRTRPVLFLSILGAASGYLGEGVRKLLVEELMRTYANRTIMRGEKNLELVQAMLVSAIWYFPPERFDEVKVYQFFHMAAVMAIELDFGRVTRPSTSRLSLLKVGDFDRPPLGASRPNSSQAECQRVWLSCYIVCGIAFMITRHQNMMRWTSFMEESIQALENPDVAVESDLYLCQWARAQRIAEEVGEQFFFDDPSANVDVSDLSVQYIFRGYEKRIDEWKAQISPTLLRPTLQIEASILSLYLHEINLYDGHKAKDFASPLTPKSPVPGGGIKPQPPNTNHLKALGICISSVKNVFDTFLLFDTDTLCSIPVLHFVRTVNAVFTMMKIHFAASRLDPDLKEMMDKELSVEFYIDQLLKCLQEVSQTGKLRIASIFRLALVVLRTWFQRQKAQAEPDLSQVRRNETIFHAVLQTADAINADSNVPEGSHPGAPEGVIASSFFYVEPAIENAVPSEVDPWPPLEQDQEMLPWDDLDLELFLDSDNSMLLQLALERLGGLVG